MTVLGCDQGKSLVAALSHECMVRDNCIYVATKQGEKDCACDTLESIDS